MVANVSAALMPTLAPLPARSQRNAAVEDGGTSFGAGSRNRRPRYVDTLKSGEQMSAKGGAGQGRPDDVVAA